MKIDLHIHTSASDGTWSADTLIQKIKNAGIRIFAVTDHDTTGNTIAASKLAEKNNLTAISGVEIFTMYNNLNYHILGYGIDINCEELKNTLTSNRNATNEIGIRHITLFKKHGYNVSLEEYNNYKHPVNRGGWRALNYVIEKEVCQNYKEYFALLKEKGNPFYNTDYASPQTAISSIKKAGGIPILAHPGAEFCKKDYKSVISIMLGMGLKGIECFHPENNPEVTGYCLDLCRKNKLSITGGSDCHGEFVKERALGKPEIWKKQISLENII